MSKVYNFDTETGVPITLNGSKEPTFYIYPDDLDFIEKATKLYKDVKEYQKQLESKYSNMEIEIDSDGVPVDTGEIVDILKEEFNNQLSMIDQLLGEGVTEKVFQGKTSIALLGSFMNFLSNVIQENRTSTVNNYVKPNRAQRRANKKVME